MVDGALFDWLVQYHVDRNLQEVIPHLNGGQADYIEKEDIGYDHAVPKHYKRFLIIADGGTLVDKLREHKVINDRQNPVFQPVPTYGSLCHYLDQQHGDGAYIFHHEEKKIARVHEVNNQHPRRLQNLVDVNTLPKNFVAYDGSVPNEEIGTKTRLALKLPYIFPEVDTFQIKGTVYNGLGLGLVTHFTREGLEMVHLEHAPESDGPFVAETSRIAGVYDKFTRRENGSFTLANTRIIDLQ